MKARSAPAGGRKPSRVFIPSLVIPAFVLSPILAEESAAGRQNTVTMPDRGGRNT
ncbi:MAG: hypothetical protein LBK61_09015 [Spirochaetaceae bacterium]|nr:hypothetical protein [Spirochaetaceae bacterium]